mgnify:CR=1 FL=1
MNKNKFKESETLELKKSTSELKDAIVSIVAILNMLFLMKEII